VTLKTCVICNKKFKCTEKMFPEMCKHIDTCICCDCIIDVLKQFSSSLSPEEAAYFLITIKSCFPDRFDEVKELLPKIVLDIL